MIIKSSGIFIYRIVVYFKKTPESSLTPPIIQKKETVWVEKNPPNIQKIEIKLDLNSTVFSERI